MSNAMNAVQRCMLIEKFEALTLSEYETLTRQRDELLAALEAMLENGSDYTATRDAARAAIDAARGKPCH